MVSPDGYSLDNFYLARPGADEIQLDLFGDYKSNVALYPEFQAYFRKRKPPLLAIWGVRTGSANTTERDVMTTPPCPWLSVSGFDSEAVALDLRESAIDEQFGSGDVAGIVGGEKHRCGGNLIGRTETAERRDRRNHLAALLSRRR